MSSHAKSNVAIVFGKWLPYHFARLAGCVKDFPAAGYNVIGLQYSSGSADYAEFVDPSGRASKLPFKSMDMSEEETGFDLLRVVRMWRRIIREHDLEYVFLPSYWNWSVTMRVVCFLSGCKVIMMNESHAGTEKARGWRRAIKKFIVSRFDGALVGGEPHRRYFASLGLPEEYIVTGYDAIDNEHFSKAAAAARQDEEAVHRQLALPSRYFLSLGRMVQKKNLITLVEAFALFKKAMPGSDVKLAFVGSGECQDELIAGCKRLGLTAGMDPAVNGTDADVLFYGFRQIDQNPAFYALSEAFVLPSIYEEWGLVVNEAMACGRPVIVSRTVGSAEDLVVPGLNGYHFDPESAGDLADKLIQLESDPEKRAAMGAAAEERIRDWGCENLAARAIEILDRLKAEKRSSV